MARPIVADRVKETTNTTGTGTLSLAGNATGFQSFVGAGLDGKPTYYAIVDDPTSTTEYEVGIGTVTAGTPNTLSRDRVIASSNSGNKVSWTTGTKTVIATEVSELLNAIMDTVDSDLVTAGSSTAYTLTTNRPAVGLYEGRFVCFKLDETCGSAPTLNVDSEGAVNLVDINGTNITTGALVAGAYYWCKYDAANAKWVVFSPLGSILDGSITTAKIADEAVTLAKMADLAQNTLIGRATASTGAPEAVGLDSTLAMAAGNLKVADASTSQRGSVSLLIASEIDTGTDTQKVATAAAIAGSKRTVKAWWNLNGSTGALVNGFGVTSGTKNSTGNYSINLAETAPHATYGAVATSTQNITSQVSKTTTVYTYKTGAGAAYNAVDGDSSGMLVY